MNKKVLIVGGSGFAGRSVAHELIKNAYDVNVISRSGSPFSSTSLINYIQCDITEIKGDDSLVESCESILYFASDSTPGSSVGNPQLELQKNLDPLLGLLSKLQRYENKHIIYLSSGGTVYGNSGKARFCEEECFSPSSYYGAGKIAAEVFLKSFQNQYGNQITILRPSNFYGVGQPYKKGFGVIRAILESAYKNESFQIWGDGGARRDYINIQDFASACLMLLMTPPNYKFNIFNIASGQVISLLELIQVIEKTIAKTIKISYISGRNCDIDSIALDCTKIANLDWQTTVSLERGISEMWDWICSGKKV